MPTDRDEQPVREFKSFTEDLEKLADWLKICQIDTVAMESTGVYWIPLFELLESRGFTVYLVNARHVKNVCGRKSDVLDCEWLQPPFFFTLSVYQIDTTSMDSRMTRGRSNKALFEL